MTTATHELMAAYEHADMIVSWEEHVQKEKRPPRWMWPFADEVVKHFERVADEEDKDKPDVNTARPKPGDNVHATQRLEAMNRTRRRPRARTG